MLQPAPFLLVELLDRRSLSDEQVRYLIGWQALLLVDLLPLRCEGPNWVVALSTEEGWPNECRRSEDAAGENPL
jgi:hypothetical protein